MMNDVREVAEDLARANNERASSQALFGETLWDRTNAKSSIRFNSRLRLYEQISRHVCVVYGV
uniref:Uncharacterized protein n=1 Tax=Pristionchus pacificus TaxID=54126 RepID=A0A2A6D3I5_PRIPA|eukprot:PDM84823.1 hypothetical protein PRIPAC_33846 [Pristionchus pacificus]